MPDYKIRDPQSGRTVTLRGDSPPTEAELDQVFAALGDAPALEPSNPSTVAPGIGLGVGAGMKAAPSIVGGLSAAARIGGKLAASKAAGVVPAAVAFDAAGDIMRGDHRRAAAKGAGAVAISQAPKVLKAIEAATSTASPATRNALGRFTAGARPAGILARMAGGLSRAAGPVGLAVETVFGDGAAGHRPAGETAQTTRDRQGDFARQFQQQVNSAAGRQVITGNTTDEIIASIAKYRGSK